MPRSMQVALLLTIGSFLFGCSQPTGNSDQPRGAPAAPAGDSQQRFGEYVVHFSAQRTDMLTPAIASTYGIVRSKNRAMLNVAVIKDKEGTPGMPVRARVEAKATNLTGQLKTLQLREIREGDAVYYIGETSVADMETLLFDIQVSPQDSDKTFNVRFQQQFFTD